jgi:uncharacterized membrane protein YbhN (UPF0104 family)
VNGSLSALRDALGAFGDNVTDAHLAWLGIALAVHSMSLLVRARVWCSILRVALPDRRVPVRPVVSAYFAGVGANAIAPAHGGDLVRVYAARRALPGASVATIVSTLVAETVFGIVVIASLAGLTASAGWLPPLVEVPDAQAFEFSFYASHVGLVLASSLALAVALAVAVRWGARHVNGLALHVLQGFRVLRSPVTFARVVALPQLGDWLLRAATAFALLAAFGIHPSVKTAILVLVVDSVATAVPFTPGGAGAQQGLLVLALAGAATSTQILAFSVGSQVVITLANILLGLVGIYASFGHVRLRRITGKGADRVEFEAENGEGGIRTLEGRIRP